MKQKTSINMLQTLFLTTFWFINNYHYISTKSKIDDYKFFAGYIYNDVGYNDNLLTVGFIFTGIFCITFFKIFNITNSSIVVRYGRNRYINNEIKSAAMHGLLFATEYCAVNTILIMIFCDFKLLVQVKFFLCSLLYFLIRALYFVLIALFLMMMRITFNFGKVYLPIGVIIIFAINSLPFLRIEKGVLLFSNIIDDWMIYSTFDSFEYIRNIIICIILAAIFSVLIKFIFTKKDILINEEES